MEPEAVRCDELHARSSPVRVAQVGRALGLRVAALSYKRTTEIGSSVPNVLAVRPARV